MTTTQPNPEPRPGPYRPPMNMTERARRAESLLNEMTLAAANYLHNPRASTCERLRAAISLSDAHRADLDTLEQAQEPAR